MPPTIAEYAEGYAANDGWAVFPVGRDKRPLTVHGFKDATRNRDIIRYWFEQRHPGAGIGLAIPEDLLIVDIDPRNGGPIRPTDLGLPETSAVSTPNGGWHLYFAVDPGSGPYVGKWPGQEGVDIKAPGKGYVILPPTPGYTWVVGGGFAKLGPEHVKFLSYQPRDAVVLSGSKRFFPWESGTQKGLAYLAKALATVSEAREGTRNNTLFRATVNVLNLVEAGELDEDPTLVALRDAGLAAGLEYPEVMAALHSAYERRGA